MELFLKQQKSVVPRVMQACMECKKRKCRCIGNPCTNCIGKKLVCVFPEAKKRGPKSKTNNNNNNNNNHSNNNDGPNIHFSGIQFMHDIQMNLNNLYQQTNLVDFYFEYLGSFVPIEFKPFLMSPSNNDSLKTQLYVIFAHIAMVYGNSELEQQFITEAQKHVNIFTQCDTIESAVGMLMMSLYLGNDHLKSPMYATLAHSITKLPKVDKTSEAYKVSLVSGAMSIDHNMSLRDRLRKTIACMPASSAGLTPNEWALCCITKLNILSCTELDLDLSVPDYLSSFANVVLSQEQRDMVLDLCGELDRAAESNIAYKSWANYTSVTVKCIIYWKCGQLQEAMDFAVTSMEIFKANSHAIVLWNHEFVLQMLLVPYFFKQCGYMELCDELMIIANQAYSKIYYYKDFLLKCEHLHLHIPGSCKFTELEQDLLGDTPETCLPTTVEDDVISPIIDFSNILFDPNIDSIPTISDIDNPDLI